MAALPTAEAGMRDRDVDPPPQGGRGVGDRIAQQRCTYPLRSCLSSPVGPTSHREPRRTLGLLGYKRQMTGEIERQRKIGPNHSASPNPGCAFVCVVTEAGSASTSAFRDWAALRSSLQECGRTLHLCSPIAGLGFGEGISPQLSLTLRKRGVTFPWIPSCSDRYTFLLLLLIDGSNCNDSSYYQTILLLSDCVSVAEELQQRKIKVKSIMVSMTYRFIPTRMPIIKKSDNRCWQGYEVGTLNTLQW